MTEVKRQSEAARTDRQHNDRCKKYKRTNNDLQNITQKTKDRETRTPLQTRVNSGENLMTNRMITTYKRITICYLTFIQ
jgi:hypothetical protein